MYAKFRSIEFGANAAYEFAIQQCTPQSCPHVYVCV